MYRINVTTGKMEYWNLRGPHSVRRDRRRRSQYSSDSTAYAYIYVQELSEAFVVKGLK